MVTASSPMGARLPRRAEYPILRGPLGDVVLRPWFDAVALRTVTDWYLPLSRAWAAALDSGDSVERFLAATYPDGAPRGASRAQAAWFIGAVRARQAAYAQAALAWEDALFGRQEVAIGAMVTAERARQNAANRLMAARAGALPLHLTRRIPPVRWEVPDPRAVAARHAQRLVAPEAAFPAPDRPAIDRSRSLPGAYGREQWLRFTSPVFGDTAWARVYEPAQAGPWPSLIYLHGIGMEPELWRDLADEISGLARRGIRVIRPEGPWHGRRRPVGWYGGEPALGRGPLGLIELFQAWVAETAVLISWAHKTSEGAVALGGVSLGALAAQLVAAAASSRQNDTRPDGVLLVATTGSVLNGATSGSLARRIGLPARLRASGWTRTQLERWRPLVEPLGPPAVDPGRIVVVLGQADDLLPVAGGLALARRWGVPAPNLFVRPQGHFSVSLGLGREPAPLNRLAALLGVS